MRNLERLFSMLILVIALVGMGQAQGRSARMHPVGPMADPVAKSAGTTNSAAQQPDNPLQVVAAILQLNSDQVNALTNLIQAKQTAMVPLMQASQDLDAKLHDLLDHNGSAADIGAIVIQLNALQGQSAKVQQDFLGNFAALLNDTQREQWQNIRQAAALQPMLNVFEALQLV